MASEGRRRVAIATYLAERRWRAVVRDAGKTATQRGGGQVFVIKGTRAWLAWAKAKGKRPSQLPTCNSSGHRGEGWWFPTLYPPGATDEDGGTGPPA